MMERQLEQMVRLIDDLLDVSRISWGKIELRRQRVALAGIVHNAIETSRPLMEARGHRLDLDIPPEAIPVDADTIRLAQVFANLLNNAATYTDPGGRIALMVRRDGGRVSVSVRDNGVGIQPTMLSRIFDPFTQDGLPDRVQSGLGIGLHIVQRLTTMHGGTVEVRSAGRGQGSEFIVHLPVAPVLAAEALPEADPDRREGHSRGGPRGRRRILIVDDNRDAADSLAAMLSMMGNDTQAAYDGLAALDMAPAFQPDVILLDIGMPRLNGYETAERIRQQPWGQHVLIVAVTGWGQEADRRRSAAAGFDRHLVKPVDLAALSELLGV
jgi:CheY-like chemotaxis protein